MASNAAYSKTYRDRRRTALEESRAAMRELAELRRQVQGSSPPSVAPSIPPAPAPAAAPADAGNRIQAAWARFSTAPAAPAAVAPPGAPAPPVAQPAPAPAADPSATRVGDIVYDEKEQRELAKMLGTVFHAVNLGSVAWCCRMLGRRPNPPSDEEERVLEKAWTMQIQRSARGRSLSPWMVIAGASLGMGMSMYRDGEPLDEPLAEVHVLPGGKGKDQDQDHDDEKGDAKKPGPGRDAG